MIGIYSMLGELIQKKVLSAGLNTVNLPAERKNSVLFVKILGVNNHETRRIVVK